MDAYNGTRRTTVATFGLIAVLAIGLAGFFYIIGGPVIVAMGAAVAVFAVLGAAHYWFWGRAEQRRAHSEVRAAPRDRLPPAGPRP
jgi:hypothetical protein